MRKFLSKLAAGAALESVDNLGDAQGWVSLDEQVDVIGHHLERVDRHIVISSDVFHKRLEPGVERTDQNRAPILGAPHQVILERKDRPDVLSVPRIMSCLRHVRSAGT
jgi:hypothetical protein